MAAVEAVFFISCFCYRCRCLGRDEIWRIQIIFAGNPDEREQGITSGIVSLERCMARPRLEEVETDGA
jgi:hypothetical protein